MSELVIREIPMKAVYNEPLGDVIRDLLVDYDQDEVILWVMANYGMSVPNVMLAVRQVKEGCGGSE